MEDRQTNEQEITTQPIENIVQIDDGKMFTTSLTVANAFEKEHKNVLQAIENLECSKEFLELNFQLCNYSSELAPDGRKYPFYQITRDGFAFLAMGFTGKKAAAWKEKFLEAFNAMEAALLARQPEEPRPIPEEEAKAVSPKERSRFFRPRRKISKSDVKAVHGLLHMESFVQEMTWDEAVARFCEKMHIERIEDLPQSDFMEAITNTFKKLFFVHTWERQESNPASVELRDAFQGMLTFWRQVTDFSETDIRNYILNRCGVDSLDDIVSERDTLKALFVLWGGIANHTLEARVW